MQLTQLNSIQPISTKQVSRVELRRYRHFADATQLNSTSSSVASLDTRTNATQLSPTIGNATDPVEQHTANQREAGQSS